MGAITHTPIPRILGASILTIGLAAAGSSQADSPASDVAGSNGEPLRLAASYSAGGKPSPTRWIRHRQREQAEFAAFDEASSAPSSSRTERMGGPAHGHSTPYPYHRNRMRR